jgi:hypothetical protein
MRIGGLIVGRLSAPQSLDLFNHIVLDSGDNAPGIAVFVRSIPVGVLDPDQRKAATSLLAFDRTFPVDFKDFVMELGRGCEAATLNVLKFFARGLSEPGYYVKSQCLEALDELVDAILAAKTAQVWAVVTALYFAWVDLSGELKERAGAICRRLLGEGQKAFAEAYYATVGTLAREIQDSIGQGESV